MNVKYTIKRFQHKHADFKDINLEKQFLAGMLSNTLFFTRHLNNFDSEIFVNSRIKKIYDTVKDQYLRDGSIVNDINILKLLQVDNTHIESYRTLIKKMVSIGAKYSKSSFLASAKVKLESLYKARIIEIGVKDVVKNLSIALNGNHDKIKDASRIITYLGENVNRENVKCAKVNPVMNYKNWLHNYKKYCKHPNELKGIPTGLEPIDKRITGIRKAEFGLCIADTGVGKSIFLLETGINCWLKEGDVIYVSIEMPAEQLENRYWCNLSGIPYERFRKLALTEDDLEKLSRMNKRFRKHDYKFHIVDMQEGCSIKDICHNIEPYIKGGNVKLVILDYLNIIRPPEKRDVEMGWETQVSLAINIKQKIARRYNVAVWSGCQVTGDKLAFANHIKDQIDIGVKFDVNEDTENTGIMEVSYPKARDFKGTRHMINTDRSVMRMWKA